MIDIIIEALFITSMVIVPIYFILYVIFTILDLKNKTFRYESNSRENL